MICQRGAVQRNGAGAGLCTTKWGLAVDVYALVRDTIYRATLLLDQQDWEQWLDALRRQFHYAIRRSARRSTTT